MGAILKSVEWRQTFKDSSVPNVCLRVIASYKPSSGKESKLQTPSTPILSLHNSNDFSFFLLHTRCSSSDEVVVEEWI